MIAYEKIAEKLGDWEGNFKPFYDLGGFEDIYTELKLQSKTKTILPLGSNLFRAFVECPKSKLKVILVGMDPYPVVKGTPVADGLAFSHRDHKEFQPSLRLIWDAIETDLNEGLNLDLRFTDLSVWAEQGVLLLNSALTTVEGKPGQHKELWKPFMTYFFQEVMSGITGIPIVFIGKQAQEYAGLINKGQNYEKLVEHPAAASYQQRPWNHDSCFSWIENILKSQKQEIDFYNLPF